MIITLLQGAAWKTGTGYDFKQIESNHWMKILSIVQTLNSKLIFLNFKEVTTFIVNANVNIRF